jgi:hypothetical protein
VLRQRRWRTDHSARQRLRTHALIGRSSFVFHAATFGNCFASTMLRPVATSSGNFIMMSAAENSAPPNHGCLPRKSSANCTTCSESTSGQRSFGG